MRKISNNIVGNWNKSDYGLVNQSSTVNMFVEQQGEGSSSTAILRSIHGNELIASLDGTPRGLFVASRGYLDAPILYAVSSNKVYCIFKDVNGTINTEYVLTVANTLDRISFAENGGQTKETS